MGKTMEKLWENQGKTWDKERKNKMKSWAQRKEKQRISKGHDVLRSNP